MEDLENFLNEKIGHWYENAQLDYGVSGEFRGISVADNTLTISHNEGGISYICEIPWFEEYSKDQIYNIWMETSWEEVA